jgi:hypothetical protein
VCGRHALPTRWCAANSCLCAVLLQVSAAQRYGLNGYGTRVCVLDNSIGEATTSAATMQPRQHNSSTRGKYQSSTRCCCMLTPSSLAYPSLL